jgi:hypothetical protein
LYLNYILGKQTLAQLSAQFNISKPTLQKYFDRLELPRFNPNPREIILVLDATYFGQKKDKDGLLVGKDWLTKEIIYYEFIKTETKEVFLNCREKLEEGRFKIKAIVTDGRPGVRGVFSGISIQMCQFHQVQIVNRYITKNPKLLPARQLKTIIEDLTKSNYFSFKTRFNYWLECNRVFLNEKTFNPRTNRYYYTHKRIRSAVNSIKSNLDYLFTYQREEFTGLKDEKIAESLKLGIKIKSNLPNTTNSLDGWFNHLKKLIRCHQGLRVDRRHKMIESIIYSSSQNFN